jgi:hypothetical protein
MAARKPSKRAKRKTASDRPKVSENLIGVRLPNTLKEEIQRLADEERRPLSNFIRFVLEQEVKRRRGES